MWFLQTDTLLVIAAFALVLGLLRKILPKPCLQILIPLASLAVIGWISLPLAIFSLLYAAAGYLLALLLRAVPAGKKVLFPLFSLLALVPFFLSRGESFGLTFPFSLVSIGLAFQMLKLIDIFYYVYYSGEPVQLLPFLNYMLYLPVFTAGPIFRYRDFLKSYADPLALDIRELTCDLQRVIRGLFKKVVLAELAFTAMGWLTARTPCLYVSAATVVISYLIVYLDLSGYSDIAIAFGRLGGLEVPENFKHPLQAPTFTQFWRSWHATLSDWIREHIYVVVAKKRLSKGISALIAMVTMVIMSLWHGFNLPYLLAGCYNGILLALENLLSLTTVNRRKAKKPVLFLRCAVVNFLFGINTLVFTLPPEQVLSILRGFFRL